MPGHCVRIDYDGLAALATAAELLSHVMKYRFTELLGELIRRANSAAEEVAKRVPI
jgi:hypothetical protein